jgi:hypothetical protein
MQHNPSFRELVVQIVNTFKHSFDSKVHTTSCQSEEIANARLSQFEKTYVSFPEFVDITTVDNQSKPQQWHKHNSALTC